MINNEEYISLVSREHRKKFGQFYTSIEIAKFMLSWIFEKNVDSLNDPAFGMGVFYDAAKMLGFSKSFSATEIDKISYDFYQKYNPNSFLKNNDYLSVMGGAYDGIVCNPPYLKFHDFKDRKIVIDKLNKKLKMKLSGYTNISSVFLIKSIHELKKGGRLAYIMPFEFLSSEYGKAIKKFLLENGSIRNIIKIEDERKVFSSSSVTTTVCIILYEKIVSEDDIVFSVMADIDNLVVNNVYKLKRNNIDYNQKWLPYFDFKELNSQIDKNKFVRLTGYGRFKRGIATGVNDFFSINLNDINRLGINEDEYSHCITKSNQVSKSVFRESNLKDLISQGKNVFIFNIKKLDEISAHAIEYIKYGESKGYNNRYLTRNRRVWFELEHRDVSPILFGVFSRGGFKIIRNYSSAKNLTCYHGFIPNEEKYIDRLFLFLKSDLGYELLKANGRKYGGKIDKLEPYDLNNTLVLSHKYLELIDDDMVRNELKYLEEYNKVSPSFNLFIKSLAN